MSGVDIATNLKGDVLAIGEYIQPEQNNTRFHILNTPVEVTIAHPVIKLWKKQRKAGRLSACQMTK